MSLLLMVLLSLTASRAKSAKPRNVARSQFPKGLLFSTASSAYQYESAVREGGRGPSIWDAFTHNHLDKIANGNNGDVAIDAYHRYKVNMEGIKYYNNLIDILISEGVEPFVTLFHWDSPQALEQQYDGFLSNLIVEDFEDYADICFREFGDRVKYWITFNEPWSFSIGRYSSGTFAPGRCSSSERSSCSMGDSGTEPYIVAHNQLLAHAATVKVYRDKYQMEQKGKIGITMVSNSIIKF